jgi:PPOX class probable FMN-dependent enzyme
VGRTRLHTPVRLSGQHHSTRCIVTPRESPHVTTTIAPPTLTVDNRFTRQFGQPNEGPRTKALAYLNDSVQTFIRQSPFLVLSTSGAGGRCDASPRGGHPGFVAILDDRHLLLPDVQGNRRFDSYQNVDHNPHAGLLFLIPGSDRTVRVNGTASVVDAAAVQRHISGLPVQNPDENAILLQGLLIEVEEAYSHCPRSFRFADLWNPDTIAQNRPR